MTVEEIRTRVARIAAEADDDESAHLHEDELHQDVLRAIASGDCADPAASAEAALQTQEIRFARWCA